MARKSAVHPSLEAAVRAIQFKVRRFHERGLGEQNTKSSLIEPVFAALGWNVRDPDEVDQEFRSHLRSNTVAQRRPEIQLMHLRARQHSLLRPTWKSLLRAKTREQIQ